VIYLSGSIHVPAEALGIGFMLTPSMGNKIPSSGPWAADSGCFSRKTYVGDAMYLKWLERRTEFKDRCLFATVPDVVGDHDATLAMFPAMADRIRDLGYPVAFVAQDGATSADVPWDDLDALFIGGSTQWKLSEAAYGLVGEGKRRGKWVHVGRVNSPRRLRAFAHAGADSADGTFLAFGPDTNLPRLTAWLRHLRENPTMRIPAA
jgi:hypothetical protein